MGLEKILPDCVRLLKKLMVAGIVMIALLSTSCGSKKPMLTQNRQEIVTVEVTNRDTVIVTERDSAMMRALLSCDSAGNVIMRQLEIAQGKINAKIDGVKLTPPKEPGGSWTLEAKFIADSLRQEISLRDKIITNLTKETTAEVLPVERDLAWWESTLMWTGAIAIIIITVAICYTTIKRHGKESE